jgi:hypothetical protein
MGFRRSARGLAPTVAFDSVCINAVWDWRVVLNMHSDFLGTFVPCRLAWQRLCENLVSFIWSQKSIRVLSGTYGGR